MRFRINGEEIFSVGIQASSCGCILSVHETIAAAEQAVYRSKGNIY